MAKKYEEIEKACVPESYGGDADMANKAMLADESKSPIISITENENDYTIKLSRKIVNKSTSLGYDCYTLLAMHSSENPDELLEELVDNFEAYIQSSILAQSVLVKTLKFEKYKIIRNQNK